MKRLLALVLALMLLPLFPALGEDEELVLSEEVELDEEVIIDDDGNEILVDQETGESFILSDNQQEELSVLDETRDTSVDPDSLELNTNLPDNVINILLLGTDGRDARAATLQESQNLVGSEGVGINQRADVWIILSVNLDTGEIKLTSLARDLFLQPPGYQKKTKITNIFNYKNREGKSGANAELCMRTLNHYFELNIKDYVAINFYGLASIIEALGGIDVDLSRAEAKAINSYIKSHAGQMARTYDTKGNKQRTALEPVAGVQHLDGVQAVVYARLRHTATKDTKLGGDFGRNERQRHLLDLLLQLVMRDISFNRLMDLVDSCLPYAVTNMNAVTMLDLAFKLVPHLSALMGSSDTLIQQHQIPMAKTYSYGKDENGNDVVIMGTNSLQNNKQALHEFIYGTYIPAGTGE